MKLDQEKLRKLNNEPSPARKSSIGRIASSVVDVVRGSSSKLGFGTESDAGDRDSVQDHDHLSAQNAPFEKRSLSNYIGKKITGSFKSGSGGGSVVTSLSDLERIEKIMTQAQYANKNIVKYFGKHLEDFRREMSYAKELIHSDIISQGIPEAMNKHVKVNMVPNTMMKNFQDWNKNT